MQKMCRVCRKDTPDLISLKWKEESQDILLMLKKFVDPKVSVFFSKIF